MFEHTFAGQDYPQEKTLSANKQQLYLHSFQTFQLELSRSEEISRLIVISCMVHSCDSEDSRRSYKHYWILNFNQLQINEDLN